MEKTEKYPIKASVSLDVPKAMLTLVMNIFTLKGISSHSCYYLAKKVVIFLGCREVRIGKIQIPEKLTIRKFQLC